MTLDQKPQSWVVQKFGGTSVGKFASQIVNTVIQPGLDQDRVAVVVSARSTGLKIEGTTNRYRMHIGALCSVSADDTVAVYFGQQAMRRNLARTRTGRSLTRSNEIMCVQLNQ